MFKRILTISAAAILPALALAAPVRSDAASSGVTVANGTITSPSGAPMPGEKVSVYTWPPDAVLAALKPGQSVPRTLLATATTSAAGRYTLQAPQAAVNAAAATTGYVNMEIDSASGFWFFTYQASPTAQSGEPSGPVTVNLGGPDSKAPTCGKKPDHHLYGFTGFKLQRDRKPTWAVVGQGYIVRSRGTKGDTVSFKYTEGSSHSQDSALGVGLSGSGSNVGFTTTGSHASTAANAEGYAAQARNTWFRTEFNVGQYRGMCIGNADERVPFQHQQGKCPKTWGRFFVHKCIWMIHSRGWFGGATTQHPTKAPHTPRGNCAQQDPRTSFSGDHGSAIKWSKGFELAAALGIKGVGGKVSFNSTAHTGYDTNALMDFKFRHKGFLCGTNRSPAHAAILVARANRP